jgi:hypothetical protein
MVNEVLCKVLCHNICCLIQSMFEMGIEATFWGEAAQATGRAMEAVKQGVASVADEVEKWAWV